MAKGPLRFRRAGSHSHYPVTAALPAWSPTARAGRRAQAAGGPFRAWASRNPPSPGCASSPRSGRGHTTPASRSSLPSGVAAPIPTKPRRPSRPGNREPGTLTSWLRTQQRKERARWPRAPPIMCEGESPSPTPGSPALPLGAFAFFPLTRTYILSKNLRPQMLKMENRC